MRIYAQHGFGPKDKLTEGLDREMIQGVVLSPRYWGPDKMREQLDELHARSAHIYMDPEYFATQYLSNPDPNLGSLEGWDYFRRPRRAALISGSSIEELLEETFRTQDALGLQEWIAPNVYVPEADSMDSAIALNFITQTKHVAQRVGNRPVFATLAFHRDAVLAGAAFRDILDALTSIDNAPDGYYIVIGSNEMQSSGNMICSDLDHPQVIAGWMYINYVLSINGARVMNSYCHLLSPLMGICGAEASASGWFSGLRKFCIERYARQPSGGQPARTRYVSNPLLSHIKITDFADYRRVIPTIVNELSTDEAFEGENPSKTDEALQSWEALTSLSERYAEGSLQHKLEAFSGHIEQAERLWAALQEAGFRQEIEQNLDRLAAMREGIQLFTEWAELSP